MLGRETLQFGKVTATVVAIQIITFSLSPAIHSLASMYSVAACHMHLICDLVDSCFAVITMFYFPSLLSQASRRLSDGIRACTLDFVLYRVAREVGQFAGCGHLPARSAEIPKLGISS